MTKKAKQIPGEFRIYEEVAEFWDNHESTDFLMSLKMLK